MDVATNAETAVSCYANGTVCTWDLISFERSSSLPTTGSLASVAISPNAENIILGSSTGHLHLLCKGSLRQRVVRHANSVTWVVFSSGDEDDRFITGSEHGIIKIWHIDKDSEKVSCVGTTSRGSSVRSLETPSPPPQTHTHTFDKLMLTFITAPTDQRYCMRTQSFTDHFWLQGWSGTNDGCPQRPMLA